MPSRDLPNTDVKRLQALEAAAAKAAATDPTQLAFTAETKTQLDADLPLFLTEMQQRGTALSEQTEATQALTGQRRRLRMFSSHYLRVFNLAIEREAFAASDRGHYQLPTSQDSLPALTSEADLLLWSQRINAGEAARVAAGGAAMAFPSAAEVQAERDAYVALQADQTTKKDAFDAEAEDVETMREGIDDLIEDIWDEVEFTFRKQSPASLRNKAREYGVVYVSRPGETPEPGETPDPGEPPDPGGPEPVTLTGQWVAAAIQAEFSLTESSDPNVSDYELRGSPGATYDPATATVIDTLTVGMTPLEFQTTEHLANPGDAASFKVFLILTTGEDTGSNTVTITRP